MNKNLIITTGHQVEGYHIVKYLGVYTGESALGTGFMSSFGAQVADFLGKNSSQYSNKLNEAKDIAMGMLEKQAEDAGGNAVIGLSLNYAAFTSDIMGVVAVGTVVLVEPDEDQREIANEKGSVKEDNKYVVNLSNSDLPFTASSMQITFARKKLICALELFSLTDVFPDCVLADIEVVSVFDDVTRIDNAFFMGFNTVEKYKRMSRASELETVWQCQPIKRINVMIRKYVMAEQVVNVDMLNMIDVNEHIKVLKRQNVNWKEELLDMAQRLRDTRLMYEYAVREKSELQIPDALIDKLQEIAEKEKIYGGMKREGLKTITNYEE